MSEIRVVTFEDQLAWLSTINDAATGPEARAAGIVFRGREDTATTLPDAVSMLQDFAREKRPIDCIVLDGNLGEPYRPLPDSFDSGEGMAVIPGKKGRFGFSKTDPVDPNLVALDFMRKDGLIPNPSVSSPLFPQRRNFVAS